MLTQVFRVPVFRLITAKLLGMVCLLFLTAGISLAQGLPTVSVADVTVSESNPPNSPLADIVFTLSAPSTQTVSVRATTQSGSATENSDFASGNPVITFNPGQTTVHLGIAI